MINEKLEKLNQEIAKGEARLRRAQHEEKILEHQVKQLTRKERTHRLCTRGAMLESFLLRPEVLTDEDVMDILKQAFSQSGIPTIYMLKRFGGVDTNGSSKLPQALFISPKKPCSLYNCLCCTRSLSIRNDFFDLW